jgi:hypothetical protein
VTSWEIWFGRAKSEQYCVLGAEAEQGIYQNKDEIGIIKYNDKINFYSHYILHL